MRAYVRHMSPAKVLVVSPDARLREEMVQVMLRDGHVVDHVAGQEDAISACGEHRPPDFIVLDASRAPSSHTVERLERACTPTSTTLVLLTSHKGGPRRTRRRGLTTLRVDRPHAISDLVSLSRMIERQHATQSESRLRHPTA